MLRYETVWFAFFASAALKSTAVLGLAWGVAKLLRSGSAAWRHLVWTAAAAVLALPFLSMGLPELRLPVNLPDLTFHATASGAPDSGARPRSAAADHPAAAQRPANPAPWMPDWPLYVVGLWAAGTAFALAQMAWAALAMARMRATARPFAGADFTGLREELGIDYPVPVLESVPGSMPMTFGLIRPAIFLPADAAQWPEERRRLVALHELAHVLRGDVATHLLARTALSFYWWNPLAWLAWHEFLRERERAADDLVLRAGARASDYAAHLLAVAQGMQTTGAIGWAAVAMARRSQLEGRLLAILDLGVNRKAIGRATAVASVVAAVALVAPFAAVQAQNKNGSALPGGVRYRSVGSDAVEAQDQSQQVLPADVEATIRAALSQTNPEITDTAAAAFEKRKQYEPAQKLLETSLAIRERASGQQSEEYGQGLAKLGDLAVKRRQKQAAIDYFNRAVLAIGQRSAAAHSLLWLGALTMDAKDYSKARQYFEQMQIADPSKAGQALTWIGLTHEREDGGAPLAEASYRQALAIEDNASPDAAVTRNLLARFLSSQGRSAEAGQLEAGNRGLAQQPTQLNRPPQAAPLARPNASAGVLHVGGSVSAPRVLQKVEPDYSELARVAKYQGTVLLYVEIERDGVARNIQVIRGLGMGLDEEAENAVSQWKFAPGLKDGQPVTVAATIEVNFRLL